MKLFIKQIILFILVCIIFFNCDNSKKKKPSLPPGFDYIIFLGTFAWGTKEEGIVVDNKNGTLNYTYKLIQTNPYFGNRLLVDKTILIRRCLIGQVYRPTENDCQGTGTKETVWGAARLQWCPTNDRSCEIDGIADPTKSPAAKACAEDNFAGKKWRLPSKDDGLRLIVYIGNPTIINDYRRISGSIILWSREASTDENIYDPIGYGGSVASKNSKINALCSGDTT